MFLPTGALVEAAAELTAEPMAVTPQDRLAEAVAVACRVRSAVATCQVRARRGRHVSGQRQVSDRVSPGSNDFGLILRYTFRCNTALYENTLPRSWYMNGVPDRGSYTCHALRTGGSPPPPCGALRG